VGLDTSGFIRDGYLAVRGAFDAATAAACRELIWESLRGQGIDKQNPATWTPVAHIGSLDGEPLTAAGTSPALTAAYDELIGPGRWTPPVNAGGAVVVRFPSPDRANSGYHIEGSYDGPGGYWVNIRGPAGCWRCYCSPTSAQTTRRPGWSADHTFMSRSSSRPTASRAPTPTLSSGGRQCYAGPWRTRPGRRGMPSCAIRS
jgi:hypothetical protein